MYEKCNQKICSKVGNAVQPSDCCYYLCVNVKVGFFFYRSRAHF